MSFRHWGAMVLLSPSACTTAPVPIVHYDAHAGVVEQSSDHLDELAHIEVAGSVTYLGVADGDNEPAIVDLGAVTLYGLDEWIELDLDFAFGFERTFDGGRESRPVMVVNRSTPNGALTPLCGEPAGLLIEVVASTDRGLVGVVSSLEVDVDCAGP